MAKKKNTTFSATSVAKVRLAALDADLQKIHGLKILTFITGGVVFKEDMEEGSDLISSLSPRAYTALLRTASVDGPGAACGLVVRQFLPETIDVVNPKGKIVTIPKKNIYHVHLDYRGHRWLLEEEVFECQYTDHMTGELMEPEKGVTCCGFHFK